MLVILCCNIWLKYFNFIYADSCLLMGTLMTHQQINCIDQPVLLRCPTSTNVVIKIARYTNSSLSKKPFICSNSNNIKERTLEKSSDCQLHDGIQYSLLQTAVEACRSKEQCQFQVSMSKFGIKPCSNNKAHIEIEYKCRPSSFNSKVGCEHEKLVFKCEANTRLAIYSASYGRTPYQSVQCPQPQGVAEENCTLSYATENVLNYCHGKRNCTLVADSTMFENPCREKSRVYLKVVYACVPRKVLLEKYEEGLDQEEYNYLEEVDQHDILDNPESLAPSPDFTSRTHYNESNSSAILLQHQPSSNDPNSRYYENREKLFIYFIGSISGVLVSLVLFVVARFVWKKRKFSKKDKYKENTPGSTSVPHSFNDDISEVDANITLADVTRSVTVIPTHHITNPDEVVRYGKEDITPRSLCQSDNNQFYYG